MTFRVGQKVVCVDLSSTPGCRWMDGDKPKLGEVYEVIGFETGKRGEELCIFIDAFPHWSFRAWRFRAVVERKTDISIFTKMLTGKRVDA